MCPRLAAAIPQSLQGSYGVVLIYRGAWCPYCQAQLAGFQRASEKLAEAGIKVVALSVDNEATTVGTIEKFKLSFPVGHSADADKVASITGADTNESPRYSSGDGFLAGAGRQDPERRLFQRSDGQIGRRGSHRHGHLSQIQGLSPRTPQ